MRKSLESIFLIIKDFFTLSLLFYLLLLVLEIIIPGLVSQNLNLAWVLIGVAFLGLLAIFCPEKVVVKPIEKLQIVDYATVGFLAVLGAVLIFYKTNLELKIRMGLAGAVGLLIIFISLIILAVRDLKPEEERITLFFEKSLGKRFAIPVNLYKYKSLFLRKMELPIFPFIVAVVLTIFFLPQNIYFILKKLNIDFVNEQKVNSLSPGQVAVEKTREEMDFSSNIIVKVLNGGAESGVAADFSNKLKESGFTKVFYGDADSFNYENAIIIFESRDKEKASLIKNMLKDQYLTVSQIPSASVSGEITVILGSKEFFGRGYFEDAFFETSNKL